MSLAMTSSSSYCPFSIADLAAADSGLSLCDFFLRLYFHYFFDCQIHICRVLFDSIYIDENVFERLSYFGHLK